MTDPSGFTVVLIAAVGMIVLPALVMNLICRIETGQWLWQNGTGSRKR